MNAVDELKSHIIIIDAIHNNDILLSLKCRPTTAASKGKILKIIETIEFIENYIKEFGFTPKSEDLKYGQDLINNTWGYNYTEFLRRLGIKKTIKCTKCGSIEESLRSDKRLCTVCKEGSKRINDKQYQRKCRSKSIDKLVMYKDSEFHNKFNFGSKS